MGIGVGAGAFAAVLPQLTNGHDNPVIDRFVPGPDLLDRNLLYEFRDLKDKNIRTANPRSEYRPYLVDLYATDNCGLLMAMVDKSIELAMTEDTRGWALHTWNERLRSTHELAVAQKFEEELVKWKIEEGF